MRINLQLDSQSLVTADVFAKPDVDSEEGNSGGFAVTLRVEARAYIIASYTSVAYTRTGQPYRNALYALIEKQSSFSIGRTHSARIDGPGVKSRRVRMYGSEIATNLQVYELFHNGCKV